ncbi:unknown [Clostridium sp. CAG:465]|jgi:hypothetical protein|nr:unknown [Clostridium sp. CAG:465]
MKEILFIKVEKSKNIQFCYGTMSKRLDRKKLFNFLLTKSVQIYSHHEFYNSSVKSFYHDAYDFIIKNLDKINHIQIYIDNAIELWSGNRNSSKLIVFEDYDFCHNELTSKLLKELIEFTNNTN